MLQDNYPTLETGADVFGEMEALHRSPDRLLDPVLVEMATMAKIAGARDAKKKKKRD